MGTDATQYIALSELHRLINSSFPQLVLRTYAMGYKHYHSFGVSEINYATTSFGPFRKNTKRFNIIKKNQECFL